MLFKIIKIRDYEAGLYFHDGEFRGVLEAGRHWFFDPLGRVRVDVVSQRAPWLVHEKLDVIVKSGALEGRAKVLDLKDYERALADYDRALKINPRYARAFHGRGDTYMAKGDVDRAIADYDEAIRLDPNSVESWNNLGIAKTQLNALPEAIEAFSRALKLKPDFAPAQKSSARHRRRPLPPHARSPQGIGRMVPSARRGS